MKKNIWIVTLIVLVFGISFVFAEEMKGDLTGNKEMMGMKGGMMGEKGMGMMGDKGMMGKGMMGMCPMMGGMMKSMMDKSMVLTSDGGVIVLSGNKLTKYDKDLNVVKEVELKADMEGMQKMMSQMMEKCPMMDRMNPRAQAEGSGTENKEYNASSSDHESHHK